MNIPFTLALVTQRSVLPCPTIPRRASSLVGSDSVSLSPPVDHTYFGGFAYSLKVFSFSALVANCVLRLALLTVVSRCLPISITHRFAMVSPLCCGSSPPWALRCFPSSTFPLVDDTNWHFWLHLVSTDYGLLLPDCLRLPYFL